LRYTCVVSEGGMGNGGNGISRMWSEDGLDRLKLKSGVIDQILSETVSRAGERKRSRSLTILKLQHNWGFGGCCSSLGQGMLFCNHVLYVSGQ
jgi:hypothetical protein